LNRGTLLLNANRLADALSDYTRLINDFPRVQMTLRAWAYNNRGYVYYRLNDRKSALADYSRVIDEMTDARIEPRLKSLFNRSRIYEDQGTPESISQAIADCSRVIDHAINAPREDSADALLRRGILYNRIGLPDKALADFTRVIELPVVSAEKVARAWGGRAWAYYRSGRQDDFLTETRRASELGPQIDFVAYQLGLALLANGYDSEAVVHYRDAVVAFPIHAPFARKDVEEAVGKWLTPERAKPVLEILKGDAP
jgi:tetratricopeptide (TPR) repeat protein